MTRKNAITTAATISVALLAAASAMAVNTGLLASTSTDGVGQLSPVSADVAVPSTVQEPPTTLATAPPRTVIVTIPRSTAATTAGTRPATSVPQPVPSTRVASAGPGASTTVVSTRTTTTVDDDDDDDDRPGSSTTSTTRPGGADDDD